MGKNQHHRSHVFCSAVLGALALFCVQALLAAPVGASPTYDPGLPREDRLVNLGRLLGHAFPDNRAAVYNQTEYEGERVAPFKSIVITRARDLEKAVYYVTPYRVFYRIDGHNWNVIGPPSGGEHLFFPALQLIASRRGISYEQMDIAGAIADLLDQAARAFTRRSRRDFEAVWQRLIYVIPQQAAGEVPDASRPVHPPGWDLFQNRRYDIPIPYSQRQRMPEGE